MKLKFLCFLKASNQTKKPPPCVANSHPPFLHCLKPHLLPVTQDHTTQLILFPEKNIQTCKVLLASDIYLNMSISKLLSSVTEQLSRGALYPDTTCFYYISYTQETLCKWFTKPLLLPGKFWPIGIFFSC